MQAPFILPMLMSVLAMAISLFMAVLAGVSAVPVIMAVDFIMLSPVHAIIAADAGETERANATKAAAVSKVFIEKSPPKNETGVMPAFAGTYHLPTMFRGEEDFLAAMRSDTASAAAFWRPGPITDAPGGDIGLAGGPAAPLRLAAIDVPGEAIDQPHVLVGRTIEADITTGQPRDQRREQDRYRNHRRADIDRHGVQRHGPIRRAIAIELVITRPRHWAELGSLVVVV